MMLRAPVASGAGCSTSQQTNAYDRLREGFEAGGTSFEWVGWTNFGVGDYITTNADTTSLTQGKPAGACNTAIKFTIPNDTATETYTSWYTNGIINVDVIQTDIYFSFLLVDGLDNLTEQVAVFGTSETPTPLANLVRITNGGAMKIVVKDSSAYNLHSNCWYSCKMSLDLAAAAGGSSLQIWSNAVLVSTLNFQRNVGSDLRSVGVGIVNGLNVGMPITLYFDLVTIKAN